MSQLNPCRVMHVCWHYCINLTKVNEALLKVRIVVLILVVKSVQR